MCDYLEQIRIYFNTHPDLPVQTYTVDIDSDCDQRLADLLVALKPGPHMTRVSRATSNFVVLLLNIVSGRISPGANVCYNTPELTGGSHSPSGGTGGITVSQAIACTDAMITDGDETNDELAGLIVRQINNGHPVPEGWIDPWTPPVTYMEPLGVDEDHESLPTGFSLGQNYPNPFNPSTNISFTLPKASPVRLEIYNMTGRRVTTLVDKVMGAGHHVVTWQADEEASGVYFYFLVTGDFMESRKMTLMK